MYSSETLACKKYIASSHLIYLTSSQIVDEEVKRSQTIESLKRMNNLKCNLLLLAEEIRCLFDMNYTALCGGLVPDLSTRVPQVTVKISLTPPFPCYHMFRGMSPTDLDKWIEEQHRRVLFRYVLEDELIKELTEVVARGGVTCQARGEDKDKAAGAESENEKWSQGSKGVKLAAPAWLGKSADNTFVDTKLQFVSEHERGEAKHRSINKKKSERTRNNSLQTEGSNSTCSDSRKNNKSPDSSTDENENIPSNLDKEKNATYNLRRLKNRRAEPDKASENTVSTPKRENGTAPNSETMQKLTPEKK